VRNSTARLSSDKTLRHVEHCVIISYRKTSRFYSFIRNCAIYGRLTNLYAIFKVICAQTRWIVTYSILSAAFKPPNELSASRLYLCFEQLEPLAWPSHSPRNAFTYNWVTCTRTSDIQSICWKGQLICSKNQPARSEIMVVVERPSDICTSLLLYI
jgi:hypothetical protein